MTTSRPSIQALWVGPRLSLLERLSIRSFLAHGHPFHLYTYGDVGEVPSGTTVLDASEVLPADRVYTLEERGSRGSYASFANLFRYALLHARGGWWVDLDVVCLRPFDFDSAYVIASERTIRGTLKICAGILCMPPQSPLMAACLERAAEVSGSHLRFGDNGFRLLGPLVAEHGLEEHVVQPEVFNPLNYWHFRRPTDPAFRLGVDPGTCGVHLWNEMWRRATAAAERRGTVLPSPRETWFDADCELGRLQDRYLAAEERVGT